MPTAVVTGANSGIGYSFAQILVKEGYDVHALDMTIEAKLQALNCGGRHECDLSSEGDIHTFAAQFKDKPVDIVLNIAGTMPPNRTDTLLTTTQESLSHTFLTNTFGPLLLTQSLLPSLLLAPHPARIGLMSSRVGSITDNTSGGSYAYRSSKAALNSIAKSMAVDLKAKGVVVVVMHPGVVKTGLDPRWKEGGMEVEMDGAVESEEAAGKLWSIFRGKGIEDSGRFWHREGEDLPW